MCVHACAQICEGLLKYLELSAKAPPELEGICHEPRICVFAEIGQNGSKDSSKGNARMTTGGNVLGLIMFNKTQYSFV